MRFWRAPCRAWEEHDVFGNACRKDHLPSMTTDFAIYGNTCGQQPPPLTLCRPQTINYQLIIAMYYDLCLVINVLQRTISRFEIQPETQDSSCSSGPRCLSWGHYGYSGHHVGVCKGGPIAKRKMVNVAPDVWYWCITPSTHFICCSSSQARECLNLVYDS